MGRWRGRLGVSVHTAIETCNKVANWQGRVDGLRCDHFEGPPPKRRAQELPSHLLSVVLLKRGCGLEERWPALRLRAARPVYTNSARGGTDVPDFELVQQWGATEMAQSMRECDLYNPRTKM